MSECRIAKLKLQGYPDVEFCVEHTRHLAECLKAKLAKERDYSAETDARFHERNEMVTNLEAQVQYLTAELASAKSEHDAPCAITTRHIKGENDANERAGQAQSRLTDAEQVIGELVGALELARDRILEGSRFACLTRSEGSEPCGECSQCRKMEARRVFVKSLAAAKKWKEGVQ